MCFMSECPRLRVKTREMQQTSGVFHEPCVSVAAVTPAVVHRLYNKYRLALWQSPSRLFFSQKSPYLDDKLELRRTHITINDAVTPSRKLAGK